VDNNIIPIFDEQKCTLFALGRNAMYAAVSALGLKSGDEVLTPAFDCDGSLQPFRALRLKLRFFRSDPYTFNADINDIKRKVSAKTKLLHIINHFGFPQEWKKLSSLRYESGIPILEDNAYSLFSKSDGKPFGSFGDFSIFSLRKNLPLAEGGMLRINNPFYAFKFSLRESRPPVYLKAYNFFYGRKNNLGVYKQLKKLKCFARRIRVLREPPPPLFSQSDKTYPAWPPRDIIGREFSRDYLRPISGLAKAQIEGFSGQYYADVCRRKHEFYLWLSGQISQIKKFHILWPDLPEGAVPFCFSFLVDKNRDLLLKTLRRKYDVMAWPTLSGEVIEQLDDFPDVSLLGRKILQINLPADKVCQQDFPCYLRDLTGDLFRWSGAG